MKLTLLTLSLFVCLLANGQFDEPKFGNIDMNSLSLTKYEKDTTAEALMLFDNGSTEFILNRENDFQFLFSRHCQLKIFKKSAFDLGDVSIRIYKNSSGKEELTNLKAVTYNLVDGKITKTKLDNDNIFKSEGKNYTDVKFAFPEIREGSIIELNYSITSDFLYNLRGWTFQYRYPANWSQYKYTIPEYFEYREASKGYLQFNINKRDPGMASFTITEGSSWSLDNSANRQAQSIKARTLKTVLASKDVPAFISEPNIDCEENYIQSIEFELKSIQFPNSMRKDYTQSWESVNDQMKKDEDFGGLLKINGFIKDTLSLLIQNKNTNLEKAVSIYNYVQNKMKWNGENRIWASKGLKKPYSDRVGTSSEINLLLTMMLQTAGLNANPVLFSTRDNGIANTFYPTISKFNSVICRLMLDGQPVMLDATNKFNKFGVLPANDINGQGRVIDDHSGDWASLTATEKYNEIKNYYLEISEDGKLTGSITGIYGGYAGVIYRNNLNAEKNAEDYFRKLQENLKGMTINKYSVSNRNDNYKPLADTLNVEVSDHAEIIGDKIIFSPLLYEAIEKNRYTLEERNYPVDYNYPISERYVFNYKLPAGYKVESMPKPVLLKLPDNSIVVSYNVQSTDNNIIIEYKRDVNKMLFLPGDYPMLKELYDLIVKKHSEQVILKKIV